MKSKVFPRNRSDISRMLCVLLILAFILLSQAYTSTCVGQTFTWSVQEGGNGHSYEFVRAPRIGWSDAQAAATAKGGYLATVTSQAENDFLNSHKTVTYFWLGGYQPDGSPEPDGGWGWITGEAFDYRKWSPTEPNNYNGVEKYIEFDGTLGSWNDNLLETGPTDFGYVIEYGTPFTGIALQEGLVAFYPFSGNAADASGNAHNGTPNNATLVSDRFGNSASAYHFNGTSSHILVPTSPDLDLVGDLSITCWVKPSTIVESPKNFDIIAKHRSGPSNAGTYLLQLANPNGNAVFAGSPYFDPYTSSASAPQANQWTHVAFTYISVTGAWKMYVNGQLSTFGTRIYNLQHNSVDLLIGAEFHPTLGFTGCFSGDLDDIRVYNRMLTNAEVFSLASVNGSLPPTVVVQPKPQVTQAGGQATFKIIADGPGLSYQWQCNGLSIPSATSSTLTLTNVQPANYGSYNVIVSNQYGSVVSTSAFLNVFTLPPNPKPPLPNFTVAASTPQTILTPTGKLVYPLGGSFDSSKPVTIVLTHGWLSDSGVMSNSGDWPTVMANKLQAAGYDQTANIIAWDWRSNANYNGASLTSNPLGLPSSLSHATSMTASEGRALGVALTGLLGQNSTKPIHFMGHSLGTLVNCVAANYLHGDSAGSPTNTTKSPPVQMTLFDEAELARAINGISVIRNVILAPQVIASSVIPKHYQWMDNYVSLVGLLHPETANVMTWREVNLLPTTAHGYAYRWYEETVVSSSASPVSQMGHRWSFENNSLNSSALPARGSLFAQSINSDSLTNPYILIEDFLNEPSLRSGGVPKAAYPRLEAYNGLWAVQTAIPATVANTVQYVGTVSGSIVQSFLPVNGQPVYIGTSGSTPAYFGNPTPPPSPGFQANWDLQLTFGNQSGSANQNATKRGGNKSENLPKLAKLNDLNFTPAVIIVPMTVPSTAVGLSFNYKFQNAGSDDFLMMGVQNEEYFTAEAVDTIDDAWNTTSVIDISNYAGQQVQLTFILNNSTGGSPIGTMQVRGIQFYSSPTPSLTLQMSGGQATASWPLSSAGWTLEQTADLTNPNSWQAVNGSSDDGAYFHSITFDIGTDTRAFFRLKK